MSLSLLSILIISIHAPHARSDAVRCVHEASLHISIHAPHARSDTCIYAGNWLTVDFNPRSSCEERPELTDNNKDYIKFQSTLLMRGATDADINCIISRFISIHAPHARSDCQIPRPYK